MYKKLQKKHKVKKNEDQMYDIKKVLNKIIKEKD